MAAERNKDINELIAERHSKGSPMLQAARFTEIVDFAKITFIDIPKPKSRRMAYQEAPDKTPVEVTLFCTGIIMDKETLPVTKAITKDRMKGHRQTVKLTGYGSEAFKAAVDGIQQLIARFERSFPEDGVTSWSPGQTDERELVLEMSCKTLMHVADRGELDVVPIDDAVDPNGHIRAVIGDKFIRTEDNVVECFRMETGKDGKTKYENMNIVELRKGDAVEAKFCLVAFPTFEPDVVKVLPVLRGITLLKEGVGKQIAAKQSSAKLGRKRMRASDDVGE
ncbi:hypothetical protein C8J56DRAFT_1060799 [Mycena floridula]|nr:hypothetical protein C8J56DRAFT_899855 [Mycena floridula]KAJ7577622.1 hypothetical protein C8J56DRAFT_1060799 [Mycena floridula]